MATLPDNRMRFPAPRIDFDADVGVTGQAHDEYPAPGQQPRYDWMRMTLIALLANQSSSSEPTQFREGTLWFDLTTLTLKIRRNGSWVPISDVIGLPDGSTLSEFNTAAAELLSVKPTATFSGSAANTGIIDIPIPLSLRPFGGDGSTPLVYINGALIDPRNASYIGGVVPTAVRLGGGIIMAAGDSFTVLMLGMSDANFYVPDVVV